MVDVSLTNIVKTYNKGQVKAINDMTLAIEKGELFGLIGPDGAGKTSTFRILTTLLPPDSGRATVNGFDIAKDYKEIRKRVGYMPGRFSLYQDLSVEENLSFFATIFNTSIKENYELIKDIYEQIEPFKKRPAGKLSGGMKQKLALCCALIHKPEVLFLDEPTTGVDVVSRKEFWEMLKRLKQQGITIMVSTPYMDEATLCDRIALIQKGTIMSVDTPGNIIANFGMPLFSAKAKNLYGLLRAFRTDPAVDNCYAFGQRVHLTLRENANPEAVLGEWKTKYKSDEFEIGKIVPTIEDCFIHLMGNYEETMS
jgi:ABC-2 type transport system ATP-binding protein